MASLEPAGGGSPPRGRRRSARRSRGFEAPVPGSAADLTPDADPEAVARGILLRKLTVAPRTRAQLADALAERDVPDDVAQAALDRFTELGLVDDEEFARQWVRSRQAGRGLARRALAHELRARGVDADLVTEALDDELDDEFDTARDLVRRKLRSSPRDGDRERQARRLLGMLARKGYGAGVAGRAVREVLAEADAEAGTEAAVEFVAEGDAGLDEA